MQQQILTATRELDPRHPALDDHRPGGLPLFGTAMMLDALGTAARALGAMPPDFEYRDVEILHPCILADDNLHTLTMRITPSGDAAGCVGEVLTSAGGADDVSHLRAMLHAAELPGCYARNLPAFAPCISAADIYGVFFHGPTYRVVEAVDYAGDVMVARLASDATLHNISAFPRLLEFALQTAGLLELARSLRMMIPHRIARVSPASIAALSAAPPVFAAARPGIDDGTDISVVGAHGVPILTIAGYQTLPLPFPTDTGSARRLGERLASAARNDSFV